jgi:hypothetical protein
MLLARGGREVALKAAQHMLDEVLESPDIINTNASATKPPIDHTLPPAANHQHHDSAPPSPTSWPHTADM